MKIPRKIRTWYRHYPTALVRWMGSRGWGYAEAEATIIRIGLRLAPTTIKRELAQGRKNLRVPSLTKPRHKELTRKENADS